MHDRRVFFGDFLLDLESFQLQRGEREIKLERLPMDLLVFMVENPSKLLSRDVIADRLWGKDVFLQTEHNINTAVNKVRAALEDDRLEPRYIRTVFGKGYRFIADVRLAGAEPAPAPEHSSAHKSYFDKTLTEGTAAAPQTTAVPPPEAEIVPPPADSRVEGGTQDHPAGHAEQGRPVVAASPATGRRWLVAAGCAAAIVLAALLLVPRLRQRSAPVPAGIRSIAVLPFLDLSKNGEQESLVDGMTDELITSLAQNTSLRVISRTSAMQFKHATRPLPEIARLLDVDAVVEGSVLQSGSQVQITAQLLDARNDRHLWAETYRENTSDFLRMGGEVTNTIARQVVSHLGGKATSLSTPQVNPQARDLYLRGRYFWNKRTLAGLQKSIALYQKAIEIDPGYAQAYAGLAATYAVISHYGGPPPSVAFPQARKAAEKALQIDDRCAQAHAVLGETLYSFDGDLAGAEKQFRRALELDPSDTGALHWFGQFLGLTGKFKEAEEKIQRGLEIDPLSLPLAAQMAETYYWARQPEQAELALRRCLELDARFAPAHEIAGKSQEQRGQYAAALSEFRAAYELSGHDPQDEALLAHAQAAAGQSSLAEQKIHLLEQSPSALYVKRSYIAMVYCALGNQTKAVEWLRAARAGHEDGLNTLAVEPLFDGCRHDPGFQQFLLQQSGAAAQVAAAGRLTLKDLLEVKRSVPVIDRQDPLDEVAEAIRYRREEHAQGKVVISIRSHEESQESL